MIVVRSLCKSFGAIPLLKDLSFSLAPGERLSLIGPGGSGKSTILKLILGLIPPSSGEVLLFGKSIHRLAAGAREEIMRRLGVAFQQVGLFDFMTVEQNLRFAMEHKTTKTAAEISQRIEELLAGVKLPHAKQLHPHELSGGMLRRIGIARALCSDPLVAIFDEPTAGLDPVTSTIILTMISDLAKGNQERCLLVATSNVETAIRFAERVVVLNEGQIVADGPWRELMVAGPPWVQQFLGVRFIGVDLRYAEELDLPAEFIARHWPIER